MNGSEPLLNELHAVEDTLRTTLREACGTDVTHADTGELIKVEEMLAIATDAAKQAISIRRKRKQVRRTTPPLPDDLPAEQADHRAFTDDAGVEWTVRAVYPLDRTDVRHARLLGTFQQGWLSFECAVSKRRLSPIPDGWVTLDDAGLHALCRQAEEASARRTEDRTRDA